MANRNQQNFAMGEVAPAYYSRTDLAMYGAALRTLRNAYVMRTGGVQNRPGTLYKGTTKNNGAARLVSCVFSDSQNYVLEFGNLYVRFWQNGSPITATVTGAWADATVYSAGTVVSYSGTNYVCIVSHTSVLADNRPSTGTNWITYWYALSGTIYELPTTYSSAQLSSLQFAQRPGVLTIVHPSHPPASLVRLSNNIWDLANIDFSGDSTVPQNLTLNVGTSGTGWGYAVAALVNNGTIVRGKPSAFVRTNVVSTSLTDFIAAVAASPHEISWSAVSGTVVGEEFGVAASLIGYSIYLSKDEENSLCRRIDVWSEPGSPIPTSFVDDGAAWNSSSFNVPKLESTPFTTSGDYPGVVGTYQGRTLYAASTDAPDTIDGSRVGVPNDFDAGIELEDDDPIQFRLVSQRTVIVRHLLEIAERFLCFTSAGEFILTGGSDGVLRPGEINPRQLSFNGASALAPLPMDDTALYVQARGNQIRNLVPANQDGYSGTDLSRTAAHLTDRYTMTAWCYQEIPHSTVWMVRSDGRLISLTYERDSGVIGWATHDTDGEYESVCVVPEGQEDVVYVVVKRSIGGTKRYIERIAPRYQYGGVQQAIPYMDSAIETLLPLSDTITGLDHLNGKAVAVVVNRFGSSDGTVLASPNNTAYTTRTVSAGQVTVPGVSGESRVMVGLPITTDIETLDIDAVGTTVKDRGMQVGGVICWVEDSGPFYAGPEVPAGNSLTGLEAFVPRNAEGYATTSAVTGVAEVTLQATYNNTGRVLIRQVDPVPLTILSIAPTGFLNGGR